MNTLLDWPKLSILLAMLACIPSSGRGAETDVIRVQFRAVAHEKTVRRGAPLDLQMTWANVGVGRLDHHSTLRFLLLDAAGEPVFKEDSKADPRTWLPGEQHLAESLLLPTTRSDKPQIDRFQILGFGERRWMIRGVAGRLPFGERSGAFARCLTHGAEEFLRRYVG